MQDRAAVLEQVADALTSYRLAGSVLQQRTVAPLSSPARLIRRRTRAVGGHITLATGGVVAIDQRTLLAPLERALHAMSWAVVLLAASLAVAKLG